MLSLIRLNATPTYSDTSRYFSLILSFFSSSLLFFSSDVSIFDSAFDTMYRRKTKRQFLRLLSLVSSLSLSLSIDEDVVSLSLSFYIGVHHPPGVIWIGR